MGASLGSGRSGGRVARYRPMSEINVTPFVDVMLVLLIVFMVTAPLLAVGVPVDLPKTSARTLSEERQPLTVTLNSAGTLFLQEQEVLLPVMVERLRAIAEVSGDTRVYLRADATLDYGRVMQVMAKIQASGFHRIALVTEPVKRLRSKKKRK